MTEVEITTVHRVKMDEDNQEDVASMANLLARGGKQNIEDVVQSVSIVSISALPVAKPFSIPVEDIDTVPAV